MLRTAGLQKFLAAALLAGAVAHSGGALSASISPSTYKKLTEIQELLGASDFVVAKQQLQELNGKVADNSLSKAIVLQTWGYAEMASNNYVAAVEKFRASLALEKLPESAALNVRYMMAQLYASEGKFADALKEAKLWFAKLEKPKPNESMFMANILAQMKRYDEAISYARRAIAEAEKPRESWYQLVLAAYFETKRYPHASDTLKQLINGWPEKSDYWEQLASVYMLMDRHKEALASLQLAWEQGLLDKESTIKSMVQMAFNQKVPERGARLLTAALDSEALPRNAEYLELLAKAWSQAREKNEAAKAYEALGAIEENGDAAIKQAKILMELQRWQDAEAALKRALDKGLQSPAKAWLLLGISQVEMGRFSTGKASLKKAQAFEKVRSQAKAWMGYADQKRSHAQWKARSQG